MLRKLVGTISIAALAMVLSSVSFANAIQITIGASTTGIATGNNNGASFSGVSGWAYQGANSGTFWITDATLHGSGCNWACLLATNSETLTVTIGTDTLVGTVSFDGEAFASYLQGSLYIVSSTTGFATTGYAVGSTVGADLSIDNVHQRVSSGQIQTDAVPEPGTIAMLGSGLLAMAGVLRRRLL